MHLITIKAKEMNNANAIDSIVSDSRNRKSDMLKCLIIEDDFAFAIDTRIRAEEIGLTVVEIASNFNEIEEALITYKIDIILSDVKLGKDIYAYDFFRGRPSMPPIIYFSGSNDTSHYLRSKSSNPYVYLIKPFDDLTLRSAVDGAIRERRTNYIEANDFHRKNESLFIRTGGNLISITPSKIKYIQSEGNYIYIYTDDKKNVIRSSIKNVLGKIQNNDFVQIHRAYAINVSYVSEIRIKDNTLLIDDLPLPIGRKFKKGLMSIIKSKS